MAAIFPPIVPYRPDYAGIDVDNSSTVTSITLVNSYFLFTNFAMNLPSRDSTPDQANNKIIVAHTADYEMSFSSSLYADGTNKVYEFDIFDLSTTVAITNVSTANPVVVTAADHGLSNGDHVAIKSVGGMVELNNRIFVVADVSGATFELVDEGGSSPTNDIDGSGFTAYTTGGTIQSARDVNCHSHRKFANQDIGALGGGTIAILHYADQIEFYMKNITDTTNITIEHLHMIIKRLGY